MLACLDVQPLAAAPDRTGAAADPYIALLTEHARSVEALVAGPPDPDDGPKYRRMVAAEEAIAAAKATTPAAALAGLRFARDQFVEFYAEADACLGDRLMLAILDSVIAVLEKIGDAP